MEDQRAVESIAIPGIADVARAAGVGLATASRALNRTGSVKPSTREKVLRTARELGYVARPALAALASMRRSSRRPVEGLPVAVLTRARNLRNTAIGTARQLQQQLGATGYRFEGFDSLEWPNPGKLARRLHHLGFVGVILTRIIDEPEWFDEFFWEPFAVVSMDAAFNRLPVPIVRGSEFQTVHNACERIRSYGYRRIGLILPSAEDKRQENLRRLAGAWAWQSQYPSNERLPVCKVPGTGEINLAPSIAPLMRRKPDALLAFIPSLCEQVRTLGIDLPLATLSGANSGILAGMTGATLQREETVALLDKLIRSASYGLNSRPVHHLIESEWIDGPSLPIRCR